MDMLLATTSLVPWWTRRQIEAEPHTAQYNKTGNPNNLNIITSPETEIHLPASHMRSAMINKQLKANNSAFVKYVEVIVIYNFIQQNFTFIHWAVLSSLEEEAGLPFKAFLSIPSLFTYWLYGVDCDAFCKHFAGMPRHNNLLCKI